MLHRTMDSHTSATMECCSRVKSAVLQQSRDPLLDMLHHKQLTAHCDQTAVTSRTPNSVTVEPQKTEETKNGEGGSSRTDKVARLQVSSIRTHDAL